MLLSGLFQGASASQRSDDFSWERIPAVSGTGIFLILDNPPFNWFSKNFVVGLAGSYEESGILEERDRRNWGEGHPAFIEQISGMLNHMAAVDIFIFSHTNSYYSLINQIDPKLRKRIRLVYNAGCYNALDAPRWLALGIGAYVGHPGTSCSPLFVYHFKHYWFWGYTVRGATDVANDKTANDIRSAGFGPLCQLMSFQGKEEAIKATHAEVFGNAHLSNRSKWRGP